ncbi:MAG: hypothetical protein HUU35_20490 [Armatimonadetes bacterium]|nr:hypothetical protein [Armatimonadota bacterium]
MLALVAAAVVAGAEPLWRQEFEGQVPGERPQSWGVGWGDSGDDLLLVSNLRAASGSRSWLLDRTAQNAVTMCGYSTRFVNVAAGWLNLSVSFLVQGKDLNVRLGLEVRGANPGDRLVAVGLNGGAVSFSTPDGKSTAALGEYDEDRWHRVRLWLPTAAGGQEYAVALLERRGRDGWEPAGPAGRIPARVPASGYGTLMPCTWPGKRGYLLFLDDLTVDPAERPPG